MAVTIRIFRVSLEFRDEIGNYAKQQNRSVSSITDLLFYEYWKGRVTLDYCPLNMPDECSVSVGLHPDNIRLATEYRRNIASHTSMRWVFIELWKKFMKNEISINN